MTGVDPPGVTDGPAAAGLVPERAVDERSLTGRLFEGLGTPPHPGVLVLHGSGGGGGYERQYARLLAHHGYTVCCPTYFGASGTPDGLARVPLELFDRAADWLRARPSVDGDRIGVVGFSRGGEATLLAGATLDGIGAVVGYGASSYVFQAPTWMDGVDGVYSAWTDAGEPLPYVQIDDPDGDPPSDFAATLDAEDACCRAVERTPAERLDRATIDVERVDGPVLLVSGGADEVWPAPTLADVAVDRLDAHDHPWSFRHLVYPDAGHAIRVPYVPEGEEPASLHEYGGTHGANARAAADAWPAALETLRRGLRDD